MEKDLFTKLLEFYDIDERQYNDLVKDIDIASFNDGHQFDHIKEAHLLVETAIKEKNKILIYGDYDADGMLATSILVKSFLKKNYPVDYYIPTRYVNGYGLTLSKVKEIVDKKYDLLICVDNGISAIEEIKYLKEHNIKVLVLDHHEPLDTLPKADIILHPSVDNYGDTMTSAAYVCFIFSIELLGVFDKYLASLAAISLNSDMMPMKEYNRNLFRLIEKIYQEHEFLQIDLLKEDGPFNETSVGMRIAPKINSIGRLVEDDSIGEIVKYFVSDDKEFILNYIDYINEMNTNRKKLSSLNVISDINYSIDDGCIIYISDTKEGLLGLVANNLVSEYRVPVIALTLDKDNKHYKGSARCLAGFSLIDAFNYCKDYLFAFGGHLLAGGCTIEVEKIDLFKNKFIEYCKTHPLEYVETKCIELSLKDLNMDNYKLVESFSPFGEQWPSPKFIIRHISTKSLYFTKDQKHISTMIGRNTRIIGFNYSMEEIKQENYIDLIGQMRLNTFHFYTTLEFFVQKIQKSDN